MQVRVRSPPLTRRDCPSRHQAGEHHAPAGGYVKVLDLWDCKAWRIHLRRGYGGRAKSVTLADTNLGRYSELFVHVSPEQASGTQVDKTTDIWSSAWFLRKW